MKVCIIDLETTGTDASRHEIIEIGALIFDSAFPKYVHTFVEHLYMRVESTKPSQETYGVVVPCAIEYHMPSKKSNRRNAGISAAVEVVKKIGV